MTALRFLNALQSLGVEVSAAGDRLHYRAPQGAMTPALREGMARHKAEILSLMHESDTGFPAPHTFRRYPLSPAQERLWFMDQLVPDSPLYNEAVALRLVGQLDIPALQKALKELARRHEALRTSFEIVEGEPQQVITPYPHMDVLHADVSQLPEEERHDRAASQIREWLRPFRLTNSPLVRVGLISFGPEEHLLALVLHHIICDGWSRGILAAELSLLYDAHTCGVVPNLPEPDLQYSDFAVWQKGRIDRGELDHEMQYWQQQLAQAPPVLELPTDRLRPRVRSYRGETCCFDLGPETYSGVKKFSQGLGVTPFMTLLAAWQTLLGRYCGQDSLIVGTIVANRGRTQFANTVGLMVNTLAMRGDLSGNPTFREMVVRVKNTAVDAYKHQELPYEKLVAELLVERDSDRNPLTDVMFVMEGGLLGQVSLRGLTVSEEKIATGTAKYDLMLVLKETEGKLAGRIEYNTDLFDETRISRLADSYRTLLDATIADPEQHINELPVLSPPERQKLIREWNDNLIPHTDCEIAHRFFEEQVSNTPDATAVVYEGGHVSYQELNARANRLANYLLRLGVGPESLVGLCLERSVEMLVGVLAIFKAGAGCLPLDPAYPRERLDFMVEDAQPLVLLTQCSLVQTLPESEAIVVCLDAERELVEACDSDDQTCAVLADNVAYLIYTSGSTGRPKAVGVSHGVLANLVVWHTANHLPKARTVQFAPMSFDVSFYEIFTTFASGGTLFMVSEEYRLNIPRLAAFLGENRIEKAVLPVVVLQQLAEEHRFRGLDFASFREVTTTGEQLQISRPIVKFFEDFKNCSLHNDYGPSESHVVTSYTLDGNTESWPAHPPIGRPIANAQMYILDRHLNPAPIGTIGELYIGGITLARGYLNRPDLTAERFIPNRFSERPGERLYKTGDMVCYLENGDINFLGRADHQVKIRGFRIELGEIESLLGQHAAVREAIVAVREESPGNKRLIAYVAADRQQPVTAKELYSFLRDRLPGHMVPSNFIIMEKLPITPNGKVDRAALTSSPHSATAETEDLIPAQTPAEELVARIWQEVLEIDKVGVNSNFFSLGGHSLFASRIILRLREIFRVELPVRGLFETPTVAGIINIMSDLWQGREIVEEIAWTFLQVEESSDEDVDKLLKQNESRWGNIRNMTWLISAFSIGQAMAI